MTTGYGRHLIPFRDLQVTDLTAAAHAAAAQRGREALAQQHQDHAKGLEQTASKETAKADKDS